MAAQPRAGPRCARPGGLICRVPNVGVCRWVGTLNPGNDQMLSHVFWTPPRLSSGAQVGEDIAKETSKDWKGLRVTVKLTVQNRQAKVTVIPSAAALVIKALKEPPRDRKKVRWGGRGVWVGGWVGRRCSKKPPRDGKNVRCEGWGRWGLGAGLPAAGVGERGEESRFKRPLWGKAGGVEGEGSGGAGVTRQALVRLSRERRPAVRLCGYGLKWQQSESSACIIMCADMWSGWHAARTRQAVQEQGGAYGRDIPPAPASRPPAHPCLLLRRRRTSSTMATCHWTM